MTNNSSGSAITSSPRVSGINSSLLILVLIISVLCFLYGLFVAVPKYVRSKQVPIEESLGQAAPTEMNVIGSYRPDGGYIAELSGRDPAQKVTVLRSPLEEATAAFNSSDLVKTMSNRGEQTLIKAFFLNYLSAHLDIRRMKVEDSPVILNVGDNQLSALRFKERNNLNLLLAAGAIGTQQVVILMARKDQPVDLENEAIKELLKSLAVN